MLFVYFFFPIAQAASFAIEDPLETELDAIKPVLFYNTDWDTDDQGKYFFLQNIFMMTNTKNL